jgi:hypothetical protein
MSQEKLKPCPFCGAQESERDGVIGTQHKEDCYIILMETELPNSPLRIMAWNQRVAEPSNEKLSHRAPENMNKPRTPADNGQAPVPVGSGDLLGIAINDIQI